MSKNKSKSLPGIVLFTNDRTITWLRMAAAVVAFTFSFSTNALCIFLIFAAVCLPGALLRGESLPAAWVHRSWSTEQGLPQSSVAAVVQTRDGYLWIGTFGGLARFDGTTFTVFDTANTPELKSSRIRALYEDDKSNLWIGTEHGGLSRYHNGVFQSFQEAQGVSGNVVVSLASYGPFGLVAGTTDGVAILDGQRFVHLATEPPLPHDTVYSMCRTKDGDLWLGTQESGLIHIQGSASKRYKSTSAFSLQSIWALAEDPAGDLWIGDNDGLLRFHNGVFTQVRPNDGSALGSVSALYSAQDGTLWLGASHGLFHLVSGRLTRFSKNVGSGEDVVRTIYQDREGSLWNGTEALGLHQWRPTNVQFYGKREGFTDRPTAAIYQGSDQSLWIGTLGGGLYRYCKDKFQKMKSMSELIDSPASIVQDRSSDLWLGDWKHGLLRLTGSRVKKQLVPGLDQKFIRSEYIDSQGALWIGTDHRGLYKYVNGTFANYGKEAGLLSDTVVYITEDHAGKLWLGFPEGVGRFDGQRFTNYTRPDLLLVRAAWADAGDVMWIGTYGYGLFRLKNGRFTRITTKEGLPEAVVSTIVPDKTGNLWMSGNRGINRCSHSELNELAEGRRPDISCVSYNTQDGLQTSETNGVGEPSSIQSSDGRIWFAMVKGVAAIRPSLSHQPAPPVVIEEITLNGKSADLNVPLRLSPDVESLEIKYAALTYLRPEHVQFKYQLSGLTQSWVKAADRRSVVYQNLSPGAYTFRIIADGGFGVWNNQGATLSFTVVPPFWRRTWFGGIMILSIVAASVLVHFIRLTKLQRAHAVQQNFSRLLMESQERERQRIAAELHDGLGQSLLIIKNRAFLAMQSLEDQESTGEQLEEISLTASDAVNEVRAIAYDLHPYQLNRFGLTKSIIGICAQASEGSGTKFVTEVESIDGLFEKEAEKSIFRVIQETVTNIVKHSQAETASLSIKRNGFELSIRVSDTGRGIDPSAPVNKTAGGFGLVGIAERVRMLGGTYLLTSVPGGGTNIQIRIPLGGAA